MLCDSALPPPFHLGGRKQERSDTFWIVLDYQRSRVIVKTTVVRGLAPQIDSFYCGSNCDLTIRFNLDKLSYQAVPSVSCVHPEVLREVAQPDTLG